MIQPAGTVLSERGATTPPKVSSGGNKANNPQDGDLTGMRDDTPRLAVPRSESPDDHFKPDFKKGKK